MVRIGMLMVMNNYLLMMFGIVWIINAQFVYIFLQSVYNYPITIYDVDTFTNQKTNVKC